MADILQYEQKDAIVVLRINRPAMRNALGEALGNANLASPKRRPSCGGCVYA
ncbi:MAG: hypothetical protein HAW65_01880 [Alphaproteobacteria bacterium]|nr:hypothetical protein [Alphaproteobacteria bacterium]